MEVKFFFQKAITDHGFLSTVFRVFAGYNFNEYGADLCEGEYSGLL